MKKRFSLVALPVLVLLAGQVCLGFEIEITVSPSTLNLESNGTVVTVHTNLPFGSVDVATVYLNGVALKSAKVDNRGFFVAKFRMEEIKALEGLKIGDYNTLKLVGATKPETGGEAFVGTDEIMVVDNGPAIETGGARSEAVPSIRTRPRSAVSRSLAGTRSR